MIEIVIVVFLLILIIGLIVYIFRSRNVQSYTVTSPYPADWISECRNYPKFMIGSEWPTFLEKEIWNSCQGCKSAGGLTDSSNKTFLIRGKWMRIACLGSKDSTSISTSESKKHWFNPPRDNTSDKPLELEWYMYMDGSAWGNTIDEIVASKVSDNNWSAFWSFPHGKGKFAWPNGGEIDLAEWLPKFNTKGRGLSTGIHNAETGAYPPCCMLAGDRVNYPKVFDNITKSRTFKGVKWADARAGGVSSWAFNYIQRFYDRTTNETKCEYEQVLNVADALTYNNIMHTYARMTTKQFCVWARFKADPTRPPRMHIPDNISMEDADNILQRSGFVMMLRTFADFGSTSDTSFGDTPTNWHQNFFFVWSCILSLGGERADRAAPLTFYLSDIMIRGGGNYLKALAPPGTPRDLVRDATEASDPTAADVCSYRYTNGRSCYNLFN